MASLGICCEFFYCVVLSVAQQIFYSPRVPPRRFSRRFSRKFIKRSYFANFSDAPDARGRRELLVVKISALNDPWWYQKRKKKSEFFTISDFSFSLFLIDFRGARLFLTSKSNSSRLFALDGQIFRSVRPLGIICRLFTVYTWGKARVTEIPGEPHPHNTSLHYCH